MCFTAPDWERLKEDIRSRHVQIVALDLPTSWSQVGAARDDLTARILDAINSMLLDVLAATARKDYDDRRHRQIGGIQKAKAAGAYKGRPENIERNKAILTMLPVRQSWATIMKATGCSRGTVAKLAKQLRQEKAA